MILNFCIACYVNTMPALENIINLVKEFGKFDNYKSSQSINFVICLYIVNYSNLIIARQDFKVAIANLLNLDRFIKILNLYIFCRSNDNFFPSGL